MHTVHEFRVNIQAIGKQDKRKIDELADRYKYTSCACSRGVLSGV